MDPVEEKVWTLRGSEGISGVGKRYISVISIHMADRTAKGIDPEADRIPFLRKGDPLGEVLEIRYGFDPCDGGDPGLFDDGDGDGIYDRKEFNIDSSSPMYSTYRKYYSFGEKGMMITYKENNMFRWGAQPDRKDIFVEVDWMKDDITGKEHKLSDEAKEKVILAFYKACKYGVYISLHVDNGCMGQGKGNIPYSKYLYTTAHYVQDEDMEDYYNPPNFADYYGKKKTTYDKLSGKWHSDYFYNDRHCIFHYMIIVSYDGDNPENTKGLGTGRMVIELKTTHIDTWGYPWFASDYIIMYDQGIRDFVKISKKDYTNAQAYTFMHELGHNLGLRDNTGASMDYKNYQIYKYTQEQWSTVNDKIHRVSYILPEEITYSSPPDQMSEKEG